MKNEINQKIAQLMDDELDTIEAEKLLQAMRLQPELVKTMSRYQMIRQAMKNEAVVVVEDDFLRGIQQSLEHEPHYLFTQQKKNSQSVVPVRFWRNTSVALVASIALFAVIFYQQAFLPKNVSKSDVPLLVVQNQLPDNMDNKEKVVATQRASLQHERLKAYLEAHSDDLYTHGSLSFQPYARVAGYRQD